LTELLINLSKNDISALYLRVKVFRFLGFLHLRDKVFRETLTRKYRAIMFPEDWEL
jgi:hypothetical protein